MHWHWHAEMSWKTGKPLRTGRSLAHAAASTLQALQTKGVKMRQISKDEVNHVQQCHSGIFAVSVAFFDWQWIDFRYFVRYGNRICKSLQDAEKQ